MQAFLNTRWDLEGPDSERDQLSTPSELAGWLRRRGLLAVREGVSGEQWRRALDVRDGLQALAFGNNGEATDAEAVARLNRALRGPGLFVQLDPAGLPDFRAEARDFDAALATIATIVAIAQLDGHWYRLKACPGRHCGWTFYDDSRNQASNWCAMSVCGSRAKAREYRQRKRASRASST